MRRTVGAPAPILAMALVIAFAVSGCVGLDAEAQATLHEVTPFGNGVAEGVSGYANLTQRGDSLTIRVEVWGIDTPGLKGTHIHEGTSCAPSFSEGRTTPGGAAGGHFNPANASHPDHAGDLGNMEVGEDGRGVLEVTIRGVELTRDDPWGILGRALVVHAGEDDLESQPAGDAGARLLCGIIRAA